MADTVTTLSLITLAQEYRGNVVRQINRRVSLLRAIPIVSGEGKNTGWVPEGDGQVAENYSEGADAVNFGSDSQTPATLNWGLYRGGIHVSNLAMDAAATASTPEGDRTLWARNLVNSSAKLASLINHELFAGDSTGTRIAGLGVAIGNNANVYGGIDRSVSGNAYWRPIVSDPGTPTAPTFAMIRDDVRQIYESCGENPDLAVVSPSIFNTIGGLFDNTRRWVQELNTARGPIRLEFGFQALELDGMFFLKDKDCTASAIHYLNTNHIRLEVLPPAEYRAMGITFDDVEADDGYGAVPLMMKYEKLAKTGASEKGTVSVTTQLVVDRPNACGTRLNVLAATA